MPAFQIAVVDEGGALSPGIDAVATFAAAAQVYIDTWLAAWWPEVMGSQIIVASPAAIPAGYARLVLAPTTDEANSLGHHEQTPDGLPIGIIELDACQRYGVAWTVTASHELGELLINPKLDRFVTVGGRTYPLEIADPVTSDSFAVNGLPMSNFSTPAFWHPETPIAGTPRYDAMENATRALPTIPHNGWLEWEEGGSYASAYGAEMTPAMIAYMRARKGRRWRLRGRR